jgi:hypothetical protein
LNISTRGNVQRGENILISGFIIQGPTGATKRTLLRAIGPSLKKQDVANAMADPFLELFNSAGNSIFPNNNWKDSQRADIEATQLAPTDDLESAVLATLGSGNYTAHISSADGGTGVGLAEVYDVNKQSAARIVNISTRGRVGTGENVLIGGFIIEGNDTADVLVRAIGPSLAEQGVADELRNPTLELFDANGNSTFNDDWQSDQKQEIEATGIPPRDPREAAIRAQLSAGNYTIIMSGAGETEGVGLVEFYALP